MAWTVTDRMLDQLRTLWVLAPPGNPVRDMTRRLGDSVVRSVGPDDARQRGDSFLGGDAHGAYLAALTLKAVAGEVDVLLHAVGIVAALPFILEAGETVEKLSLDQDSGGTGDGDLTADVVTSKKVAEVTFIRWAEKKGNGTREVKLLRDLINLDVVPDEDVGDRSRILYVTGGAPARRFLSGRTNIAKKLKDKAETLDMFRARYGDRYEMIGPYWQALQGGGRITLVDLYEQYPGFVGPDDVS